MKIVTESQQLKLTYYKLTALSLFGSSLFPAEYFSYSQAFQHEMDSAYCAHFPTCSLEEDRKLRTTFDFVLQLRSSENDLSKDSSLL